LSADSDAAEVRFVDPGDLGHYSLTEKAEAVIARALALDREAPRPAR
jgi:hypothetical protein